MGEARAALPRVGRSGGLVGAQRQALVAEVLGFLLYCEWRVDRGAALAEVSATCGRLSAVGRTGQNLITCSDDDQIIIYDCLKG